MGINKKLFQRHSKFKMPSAMLGDLHNTKINNQKQASECG